VIDVSWFTETAIKWKEDERRVPAANWFEICAAVGKSEDELFRVLEFTEGSVSELEVKTKGEF